MKSLLSYCILGLAVVSVICQPCPSGSNASEFTTAGLEARQRHDFETALNCFESAIREDALNSDRFFYLGTVHMDLGHHQEAYDAFQKVLEMNPNHVNANMAVASLLSMSNMPIDALKHWVTAATVDTSHGTAHFMIGKTLVELQQDLSFAINHLQQAVGLLKENNNAKLLLTRAFILSGKLEEAEMTFKSLTDLETPEAMLIGAELHLIQKQFDLVEQTYQTLLSKDEISFTELLHIGIGYEKMNQYELARKTLLRAIDMNPTNPLGYAALGTFELNQKKYGAAIDAFTKGIESDDTHLENHVGLSAVYLTLNQGQQAVSHLQHVLKYQPTHVKALLLLSKTYDSVSEHERAFETLLRVYALAPSDLNVAMTLGERLYRIGNVTEAVEVLNKARDLPHATSSLQLNLIMGEVAFGLGDLQNAHGFFSKALQLQPQSVKALMFQGRILDATHHYSDSIQQYESILDTDSLNQEAHLRLGVVLYHDKQFDNSLAHLKRAAELNTSDASVYLHLGNNHVEQGLITQGVRYFEKAIVLDPTDTSAHFNLAMSLKSLSNETKLSAFKHVDTILSHLTTATQLSPSHAVIWHALAQVHFELGDLDACQLAIAKSLQANSGFVPAHVLLSQLQLAQSHFPDAIRTLSRVLQVRESSKVYTQLAKGLMAWYQDLVSGAPVSSSDDMKLSNDPSSLLQRALSHAQKATALPESDVESLITLAQVYALQGEIQKAITIYEQVLEQDATHASAISGVAECYRVMGHVQKAMTTLKSLIELEPHSSSAFVSYGELLEKTGDTVAAAEMFQRAIDLDPTHPGGYNGLATILSHEGKFDEAETQIRQMIRLDPNLSQSFSRLADMFYEAYKQLKQPAKLQQAMRYYQEAIELSHDTVEPYLHFANVLMESQQVERAVPVYQRAIALRPKDANLALEYAKCLHIAGNATASLSEAQRAVQLNPLFADGFMHIGKLLQADGQHEQALQLYGQAFQAYNQSRDSPQEPISTLAVTPLLHRARIFASQGQLEQTQQTLQLALQLDVTSIEAHQLLASFRRQIGALDDSVSLLVHATTLEPENSNIWFTLSQTLYMMPHRALECQRALKEVLRLNPSHGHGQLLMGRLLLRESKAVSTNSHVVAAIPHLQAATRLLADYPIAFAELSNAYRLQGDLTHAEQMLARAIALSPDTLALKVYMGELQQDLGNLDQARVYFEQVVQSQVSDNQLEGDMEGNVEKSHHDLVLESLGHLARLADTMGDLKSASHYYQELLRQSNDLQSMIRLGQLFFNMTQYDDAIAILEKALDTVWQSSSTSANSSLGEILSHLGDSYLKQGNVTKASHAFESAINYFPKRADLYHKYGTALETLSKSTMALMYYQEAIKVDGHYAPALYDAARLLASQGKLSMAIDFYERTILEDPMSFDAFFGLGKSLSTHGLYTRATEAFSRAVELNPTHAEAWLHLGNNHRFCGEIDAAIEAYTTAISIDPNHPDGYNNLAVVFDDAGNHTEAIKYFQMALAQNSTTHENSKFITSFNQARAFWMENQYEEALEMFKLCNSLDSTFSKCMLGVSQCQFKLGQLDLAVENAQHAIKMAPRLAEGYYHLAEVYLARQESDLALECYRNIANIRRADSRPYYQMGEVYLQLGKYDLAIESYEKSYELAPKHVMSVIKLGNTYFAMNRYGKAQQYYERAVELDPTHSTPYNNLAAVHQSLGDMHLALELSNKALAIDPQSCQTYFNIGKMNRNMGLYDQAMGNYTKAVECDPKSTSSYDELAHTAMDAKDYPKAQEALDHLIRLIPNDWRLYNLLGMTYDFQDIYDAALTAYNTSRQTKGHGMAPCVNGAILLEKRGKLEEAFEWATCAVHLAPDSAEPLYIRGKILSHMGRYKEAVDDLENSTKLANAFALAYYALGTTYKLMGDFEQANNNLLKAVAFDPGLEDAKQDMKDLFADNQHMFDVGSVQEPILHGHHGGSTVF